MTWSDKFTLEKKPDMHEIGKYINNSLWDELCEFIEEKYGVLPKIEYSKCSAAPGWNVKYKKGGKSICTVYPKHDYFTCLIVMGEKQKTEAEFALPGWGEYVQNLYKNTKTSLGGKWLMIDVTSEIVLMDVKELICLRIK